MSTYDVVLFLHIAVAIAAFGLAATLHTCELLMRRAGTVAELRTLAKPGRLGPAFGVIVLLLFGFGSWLVHLSEAPDKFHFSDPFVWTGTAVLAFLFLTGPTVLGRHHKHLEESLAAAVDGPVTPELRRLALAPVAMVVGYVSTFSALGVVFNMATKPGDLTAVAVVVVAVAIGAALGLAVSRPVPAAAPEAEAVGASEPA